MVKNLKLLRNEHGLSQQELAEHLGINQQSINGYENRATQPDIELLMRIADYFHTTVDYLIGYDMVRNDRLATVNPDEMRLLENLRALPCDLQTHVKGIINECAHAVDNTPHI